MANEEHLKILKQGVEFWNKWRDKNPNIQPDLSEEDFTDLNLSNINLNDTNLSKVNLFGANLRKANLIAADLSWANLTDANLINAQMKEAKLQYACLHSANLRYVNLKYANLSDADLSDAILCKSDLSNTTLYRVDLSGADLSGANLNDAFLNEANLSWTNFNKANLNNAFLNKSLLIETNFENANLSDCSIYGISAWGLNLTNAIQKDLIIYRYDEPAITVDNLEVAQFIYLLLHNEKIRDVIDTIGKKAVLILGRFTEDRKAVLDTIREELRKRDYLPILFDFEGPKSKDLTETVSTLAHMARFIIADITDAKAIPQELQAIVPNLPSVAFQPLLQSGKDEYGMFEHLKRYPWVLNIQRYRGLGDLLDKFEEKIIAPIEAKVLEIRKQNI